MDWTVADSTMLYARFSRGFKPGGFFAAVTTDSDQLIPYAEEINDSFEIGVKSNPTNDLQINVAAFFYGYQDAQGMITVESLNTPTGILTTVGNAEHYGVEVDLSWAPSGLPGLRLDLSTSMAGC